jgi:hypothetical protein
VFEIERFHGSDDNSHAQLYPRGSHGGGGGIARRPVTRR